MTAPLTPEERAEVETRAEAAKWAFLRDERAPDDFYTIAASSADVPKLLAVLDAAEERAHGALARVEALMRNRTYLVEFEGKPYRYGVLVDDLREAMEGKP